MMRGRKRLLATLLLVMVFCFNVFSINALAASTDETEVGTVKFNVTNSDGIIKFESRETDKYTVLTSEKKYNIGETDIIATIEVKPQSGYYFKDNLKTGSIKLYGTTTGIKVDDVWLNANNLIIDFDVRAVRGKLKSPESAWWDDDDFGIAHWDKVDVPGVTSYEISINGKTKTTKRTSIDLSEYLEWGKNNTFKVKATSSISGISDSSFTKSDKLDLTTDDDWWDEYYDEYYYDDEYCHNGYYNAPYFPYDYEGRSNGWHNGYYYSNGNICRDQWIWDNSEYYYVASDGRVVTGWRNIGGKWYVFKDNGVMLHDTTVLGVYGHQYKLLSSGEMQTYYWGKNSNGWYYVNNTEAVRGGQFKIGDYYYRFTDDGYMITGWWMDTTTGQFYYYDTTPGSTEGRMLVNTSAYINGRYYRFDQNGRCQL